MSNVQVARARFPLQLFSSQPIVAPPLSIQRVRSPNARPAAAPYWLDEHLARFRNPASPAPCPDRVQLSRRLPSNSVGQVSIPSTVFRSVGQQEPANRVFRPRTPERPLCQYIRG